MYSLVSYAAPTIHSNGLMVVGNIGARPRDQRPVAEVDDAARRLRGGVLDRRRRRARPADPGVAEEARERRLVGGQRQAHDPALLQHDRDRQHLRARLDDARGQRPDARTTRPPTATTPPTRRGTRSTPPPNSSAHPPARTRSSPTGSTSGRSRTGSCSSTPRATRSARSRSAAASTPDPGSPPSGRCRWDRQAG